ncbi:uncharacterized protein LOC129720235 [Wyeomyia smithii]|uniref:uncharacterized protein LOC129720235 n=1 Tax=Wyeomyia smithii TaxID=174621 RepID=UPI002467B464|nr:uncharacterized protein LOC129720235 [Wyeomyia smithii]
MFDEIRHRIRSTLRECNQPKPVSAQVAVAPTQQTQSKLPEIPLPRFNGQLEDWISFKGQFNSLVKRREGLSESEKLFYLKAAIQDGAARHVQSAEDTFSCLWRALCGEFENKRLLVDKHIAQLFHVKPIFRESGSALRSLINDVSRNLRALSNLELKLGPLSEQFVVHLICSRLDSRTRKDFELQSIEKQLPSWEKLLEFLQSRCRCLENIEHESKVTQVSNHGARQQATSKAFPVSVVSAKPNTTCFVCKGAHYLSRCEQFLKLVPVDRFAKVKNFGLCLNCFSNKHRVADCKSSSCRKCARRHHTLIHESEPNPVNAGASSSTTNTLVSVVPSLTTTSQYVLYTAVVQIEDEYGNSTQCRILLDCGSMHNLISTSIVNALRLRKFSTNISIEGVSGTPKLIKNMVGARIRSISNKNVSMNLNFLVMKRVTSDLPIRSFPIDPGRIPVDVQLADPQFNRSRRIDMLLGIQAFNELFTGQSFSLTDDGSFWCKETVFGWVVGGAVSTPKGRLTATNFCGVVTNENLSEQISKFWEMETFPEPRNLTKDERAAEQSFLDTYRRLSDGRYEIGLPLKSTIDSLGDSQTMALRRFVQMERRLIHDATLRDQYLAFMSDYSEQGHMIKAEYPCPDGFFLPHHAVFNPASTTTKTRVVFDASASTTSGTSLNDHLLVGPVLQRKLTEIVLRFRVPKIVFTADIKQMFRQIVIRPSDRKYQQVFWRARPEDPLEVYQLATVTYGTACAPFLATRTLEQLCKDERKRFPLASQAGTVDFYVDDLLSGAETIEKALDLQNEFIQMMASGGFKLHKWASNCPALLESVPNADNEQIAFFKDEKTTRTLGLTWQPRQDVFLTKLHEIDFHNGPVTKRSIYSDIAKLYDPLGLLGPVIFAAKIRLQRLWQLEIEWDDVLSDDEAEHWTTFRNQLVQMGEIPIKRGVFPYNFPCQVELHGFCDASNLGYGACVYVRSINNSGHCSTILLTSKSRIAPLKNAKPTIPRLELCGARELARLISNITHNLNITFSKIVLWCDSTTAISWIKTDPSKLKTFVCNRVIEIQQLTKSIEWRHVNTNENLADFISRGLLPSEIRACKLWWFGPTFLTKDETDWPVNSQQLPIEQLPESRNPSMSFAVIDTSEKFILFARQSSFRRMQRVMAFALRFIDHIQRGSHKDHRYGQLTIQELDEATKAMISIAQREAFPRDFRCLESGQVIHQQSKLTQYSVFLDKSRFAVMRVGGRNHNASWIPIHQRHPMILPPGHPFTHAVVRAYHVELLHAPQQLLLNALQRRYSLVHGRSTVRWVIRRCVTCFKAKPVTMQQMMGNLPKSRLEGGYTFRNTGVDFCGPVYARQQNKRSTVVYKAYVAVFVCFATKAIHLELVSNLTADAFIAALQRFISRRGKCERLFSDNGLNFVGSKNKLREMYDMFRSQLFKHKLDDFCSKAAIDWHLIPPNAPHFGGLWEAGVRSAKYHLKRIIGTANLNFEEYATVLARIEAVLNSRPITPMSVDPNDVAPLTPGHFLVGRPLTDIAEPDVTDHKESTLSRWQRQTQMVQHFWRRWSNDYITTLQNRNKWHERYPVKKNQMVIVREDNLPTMQWKLGRISNVIPGPDGLVRVVDVRVGNKLFRRPIAKLCLLPIADNFPSADNDFNND